MRRTRSHRPALTAGMTPLVDTLFLLLFSLLALSDARTSQAAASVRVELPRVEPGDQAPTPAHRIALEITRDSEVRLAGSDHVLASRAELDRALAAALDDALPEEVEVVIQADRDARHGVAVELLQHLRVRGFVHVALLAVGASEPGAGFGGDGG